MPALSNCTFLDGVSFAIQTKSLQFSTRFDQQKHSNPVDCSGLVGIPGFVNWAAKLSHVQSSIQQGCSSNFAITDNNTLVMTNGDTEYPCCFKKTTRFGYTITSNGQGIIKSSSINNAASLGYASGNDPQLKGHIWQWLQQKAAHILDNQSPQTNLRDEFCMLLRNATSTGLDSLGIKNTGALMSGYFADFVLIKIQPNWDLTSTESLLQSMFLYGPENEIAAVYKAGELLYKSPPFEDLIRLSTISDYYTENGAQNISTETLNLTFDSIDSAIQEISAGNFVVVVDNEDRENEGDLVIAAEFLTEEKCAFMIRYTRYIICNASGVICAPASAEILERLEIPMMVERNQDSYQTAYTVSIDAVGTTTGISARDRSFTIRSLAKKDATRETFTRPGHVFPLRSCVGGVLQRVGHTEASIDLCVLAGLNPVAAISEIVLDDGRMARRDDLRIFAKRFGLKIVTIAALAKHRKQNSI